MVWHASMYSQEVGKEYFEFLMDDHDTRRDLHVILFSILKGNKEKKNTAKFYEIFHAQFPFEINFLSKLKNKK